MKTARALALCRSIYRQKKAPEDETGPRVENRRVSPQKCRGISGIAAFLRQNQGVKSLILARNISRLRGPSWYIPFLVIWSADPSDVRKRLDSMYLLDNPLLGLQVMRD